MDVIENVFFFNAAVRYVVANIKIAEIGSKYLLFMDPDFVPEVSSFTNILFAASSVFYDIMSSAAQFIFSLILNGVGLLLKSISLVSVRRLQVPHLSLLQRFVFVVQFPLDS